MPIYAYKCQDCGHQLEKLQRIGEPSLTDCPQCGQSQLRKQITAAAFKLKGTGWYETDFKNKQSDNDKNKKPDKTDTAVDSKKNESKNGSKDSAKTDKPSIKKDAA